MESNQTLGVALGIRDSSPSMNWRLNVLKAVLNTDTKFASLELGVLVWAREQEGCPGPARVEGGLKLSRPV